MKRLTNVSFFMTLGVSCLLLVVPTYMRQTETNSVSGAVSVTHATLLQVNGPRVLIVLVIPVLITLIPMLARNRGVRIAAAVVLASLALITVFSIGLFYLPSAGTLIAASVLKPRSPLPGH